MRCPLLCCPVNIQIMLNFSATTELRSNVIFLNIIFRTWSLHSFIQTLTYRIGLNSVTLYISGWSFPGNLDSWIAHVDMYAAESYSCPQLFGVTLPLKSHFYSLHCKNKHMSGTVSPLDYNTFEAQLYRLIIMCSCASYYLLDRSFLQNKALDFLTLASNTLWFCTTKIYLLKK